MIDFCSWWDRYDRLRVGEGCNHNGAGACVVHVDGHATWHYLEEVEGPEPWRVWDWTLFDRF